MQKAPNVGQKRCKEQKNWCLSKKATQHKILKLGTQRFCVNTICHLLGPKDYSPGTQACPQSLASTETGGM